MKNNFFYKKVIFVSSSVNIEIKDGYVSISGKLGKLVHKLNKSINVQLEDLKYLNIYSKNRTIYNKSLVGTTRSLINGMIIGVTVGFVKKLKLVGIGYRASISEDGNLINLTVGLSHLVYYKLPKTIKAQCFNQVELVLTSIDKQLLGQVAADLRFIRPPEPFKGKGIRYLNEVIHSKETKKK